VLKVQPNNALQVIKESSIALLNSGEKVFRFNLKESLEKGTSGLESVQTNVQLLKRCRFYPVYNRWRQGFVHPSYLKTLAEYCPQPSSGAAVVV